MILLNENKNMDPFFAAEIDQAVPQIDLHHTTNIADALDVLEKELYSMYTLGVPYLRVIHGIGEGALARAVHKALEKNPMVVAHKQTGGSTIVLF